MNKLTAIFINGSKTSLNLSSSFERYAQDLKKFKQYLEDPPRSLKRVQPKVIETLLWDVNKALEGWGKGEILPQILEKTYLTTLNGIKRILNDTYVLGAKQIFEGRESYYILSFGGAEGREFIRLSGLVDEAKEDTSKLLRIAYSDYDKLGETIEKLKPLLPNIDKAIQEQKKLLPAIEQQTKGIVKKESRVFGMPSKWVGLAGTVIGVVAIVITLVLHFSD